MKRIICLALCIVMAVACFSFSTFAASNSEKLISKISATIPSQFRATHLPQAEKILRQINISDGQYEQLKAIIETTNSKLKFSKKSAHSYTQAEQDYIVSQFRSALEILDLHYTTEVKPNALHSGDVIATVYNASGEALGTLDGDVGPGKTDTSVSGWTWALIAAAFAAIVTGAVVYSRKKKFAL